MYDRYINCRKAMFEHQLKEKTFTTSPEAFYLSFDYTPQDVVKSVRQEFYKDLRHIVKAHPKLKYLMLAAFSAPFTNDILLFHFFSENDAYRDFIAHLTTSLYGRVQNMRVSEEDMESCKMREHKQKAYYFDRFSYDGDERIHLLEELVQYKRNDNSYRYSAESGDNVVITATAKEEMPMYYTDEIQQKMIIFNVDLLEPDGDMNIFNKFKMNCVLGKYRSILNPQSSQQLHNQLCKCMDIWALSPVLVPYIEEYPHLENQIKTLYRAANFLNEIVHIKISQEEVDTIIMRNCELYRKNKHVADIMHDCDFSLPYGVRVTMPDFDILPKPQTVTREWVQAKIYYADWCIQTSPIIPKNIGGLLNEKACIEYALQKYMDIGVLSCTNGQPDVDIKPFYSTGPEPFYVFNYFNGDITQA